jgi:hypothetical protein
MKLAIIGGRDFNDYKILERYANLIFNCNPLDYFDCFVDAIISGGARGADSLAKKYAMGSTYMYIEFPADWDKHGKTAGFIRNQQIVDECDMVLAFWDGVSRGTQDTIRRAKKGKKPTWIVYY